jgi:hypothetical protein
MSVNGTTGSSGGILRSAILLREAIMSQAVFIVLVFVAGFGVGYGVRSQIVIMHRDKIRRRF